MALWIELVQNRNRFVCGLLSEARRTCAGTLGNKWILLSASSRWVHVCGRPRFRIFSFSRPPGAGEGGEMRDPGSEVEVRIHLWYTCHVNGFFSSFLRWILLLKLSLSLCLQSDGWYLLSKIRRCRKMLIFSAFVANHVLKETLLDSCLTFVQTTQKHALGFPNSLRPKLSKRLQKRWMLSRQEAAYEILGKVDFKVNFVVEIFCGKMQQSCKLLFPIVINGKIKCCEYL